MAADIRRVVSVKVEEKQSLLTPTRCRTAYLSPSRGVGVMEGAAACVAGRVIHDAVAPTHRVVQLPGTAAA